MLIHAGYTQKGEVVTWTSMVFTNILPHLLQHAHRIHVRGVPHASLLEPQHWDTDVSTQCLLATIMYVRMRVIAHCKHSSWSTRLVVTDFISMLNILFCRKVNVVLQ